MRRTAIPAATVLLFGLAAVPATAAPVSIADACAATIAKLATTGGTNGSAVFAGSRFSVGNLVVVEDDGTYGDITQELTPRERKAAYKYLKYHADATSWGRSGWYFGTTWNDSYSVALAQASGLPADCAAAAGPLISQAGNTYTFTNASVDIVDGSLTRWDDISFTLAAQQVDLPPGPTMPYSAWQRPSEAASLNSTLRSITRTVAQTVTPTRAGIMAALRAEIDPDRAVPLRLHRLRQGGLVSGRNPYTKTYHAWRVYLKNGTPIARKVAP